MLTLLSSISLLAVLALFGCSINQKTETSVNVSNYTIDVPYKENFQILQLSDTHWMGGTDWTAHKNFITKIVHNEAIPNGQPDFIVITGDCVNDSNLNDWKNYCDFFDSFKIPWTLTFGNHDARAEFSMDELTQYLNERSASPNSFLKFKNNIGDNIQGDANFAINLVQNNEVKEQLIVMDSNRYRYSEGPKNAYTSYDYIHTDQVEWYKKLINWTTQNNDGQIVPSLAFFHIPLQEYLLAYEEVQRGENEFLDEGRLQEEVCCPYENTNLFAAMKDLKSTNGIFVGHDHVNNASINYQGIKLVYGLKSSDYIYHEKDWLGGRLISLKSDGDFDSKFIKNSY